MTAIINNISINDDLWLTVTEKMLSFQFKGMNKDIHFTISYNTHSADINFHATRNTGNDNDKPHIEITRISKDLLEELVPSLALALLNKMLLPINLKSFGRKCRHSHYGILFFPISGSIETVTEKTLIKGFKPISRVRKNRLKIKGDVEQCIKNIIGEENVIEQNFLQGLAWLPKKFDEEVSSGFIITKRYQGIGVRMKNRWFSFNKEAKLIDILGAFMPYDLAKHLIFKTIVAYARIKTLETRMESDKYSCSLRLTGRQVDE